MALKLRHNKTEITPFFSFNSFNCTINLLHISKNSCQLIIIVIVCSQIPCYLVPSEMSDHQTSRSSYDPHHLAGGPHHDHPVGSLLRPGVHLQGDARCAALPRGLAPWTRR